MTRTADVVRLSGDEYDRLMDALAYVDGALSEWENKA